MPRNEGHAIATVGPCEGVGPTLASRLAMAIDPAEFRAVLGAYPTGVCVVTSTDMSGNHHAMVVGSFCSISLDPPLVGFFPAKTSRTWRAMRDCTRFCINVLGANHTEYCDKFTARAADKFAGINAHSSPGGQPRLQDALAWIDVTVAHITDVGDHDLVVGRVTALAAAATGEPLIFFRGRYRALAGQGAT